MRKAVFLWVAFFSIGLIGEVFAQHKLFAVSGQGRGSEASARQAAQIDQLESLHSDLRTAIETCSGKGKVYAPMETDADVDGCLHAQSPCGDLGMLYGPNHPDADDNGCLAVFDACGNDGMIPGPEHAMVDSNGCVSGFKIKETGVVQAQNGLQLGDQPTCDTEHEGVLRYSPAVKTVLFCDGEFWQEIGAAPETSTTFNDVTGAEPEETYTTGQAQVSGFFGERTVTADNGALILVNGGLQGASATVQSGDSVQLRMDASSSFSASKTTTMTMGSLVANWTITTRPQDITPNAFSFGNLSDQELDALATSNGVTVSGFDGPLTATVSGQGSPQLRVGNGNWATSASIQPGQVIRLRLTTSSNFDTKYSATAEIGSVSASWGVETKSNCHPDTGSVCGFQDNYCPGLCKTACGGCNDDASYRWATKHSDGSYQCSSGSGSIDCHVGGDNKIRQCDGSCVVP